MKLSVIIVNYNVKFYLAQCVDSVQKAAEGLDYEVFVVDNNSSDKSVEYIVKRFPWIHIISSAHNKGFAWANNVALERAKGEFVLLLNPDTFVCEDTIKKAINFLDENPQIGGAGVKMYNSDGTLAMESRRGLPTPLTSFYKMCGLCSKFPQSRVFGKYYMGYLSWDEPQKIEVISGACFFIRHEALKKVGLLDEDFFMYGEDIDLSYRLLHSGYENWYLPWPILHYKGESTQKTSFHYVHVFYSAMLIFFRKHYGHLSMFITAPIKVAIYLKALTALFNMQSSKLRHMLGFVSSRRDSCMFVFIGSKQMVDRCKRVARHKGLQAEFFVGTEATMPHGHNSVKFTANSTNTTFVVYDKDAYSYSSLLKIMEEKPCGNIKLGTYSSKLRLILTPTEIITW